MPGRTLKYKLLLLPVCIAISFIFISPFFYGAATTKAEKYQFPERLFLSPLLSGETAERGADPAYSNYILLNKLYIKWREGFFGSRSYYRRKTSEYLISIMGQKISTEYNYIIVASDYYSKKRLICRILPGKWLEIQGKINEDDLKKITQSNNEIFEKWWRLKKLLSVKGTLKNYKLGKDKWGEVVTLYLDDIRLEQIDNTE